MQRTKRIVERLPEFYRAWDHESLIYRLSDSLGRALNEEQKEKFRVLRTHWVDTAFGLDLDKLGVMFQLTRESKEPDETYRERIKRCLEGYEGGGTRKAILTYLDTLLNAQESEIEIVENPQATFSSQKELESGEIWKVGSMSVDDATPSIEMEVGGSFESVKEPALTNLATGEEVRFKGTLQSGGSLRIAPGSAELGGESVTTNVIAKPYPTLMRSGSEWKFGDALSPKIARFDVSKFDENIFDKAIPRVTFRFNWTGRLPSTFELRISKKALDRSGFTIEDIMERLKLIKGAGISMRTSAME